MTKPYSFKYFKDHYYEKLKENYKALEKQYKNKALSKSFEGPERESFRLLAENILSLENVLPSNRGGQEPIDGIKRHLESFIADGNYWSAQEIKSAAFDLHLYMEAMVEDE